MQKLRVATLQTHEPVASSAEWRTALNQIDAAITAIVWPEGSDSFSINPVKQGNGVKPIKDAFVLSLRSNGWAGEQRSIPNGGKVDSALTTRLGIVAVEWETGNISSSHRSLNRLALGLLAGSIAGGVLVLPSRALYRYLTDRVGNFQELEPYFDIYRRLPIADGVLTVIEVEHDAEDDAVPLIRRGLDGMSLVRRGHVRGER